MYKYRYKIIGALLILEYIILNLLTEYKIEIKDVWGNAIGTFLCSLPFEILFLILSKERKMSKTWRFLFKGIFWFWIFCYLMGLIVEIARIKV